MAVEGTGCSIRRAACRYGGTWGVGCGQEDMLAWRVEVGTQDAPVLSGVLELSMGRRSRIGHR